MGTSRSKILDVSMNYVKPVNSWVSSNKYPNDFAVILCGPRVWPKLNKIYNIESTFWTKTVCGAILRHKKINKN